MARGWESKAIEGQQEEALAKPSRSAGPALDPVLEGERGLLRMARNRALADLQVACAPAHRAMLEQAVADLESRLAALDQT